jgi:aspartate aminotransferase
MAYSKAELAALAALGAVLGAVLRKFPYVLIATDDMYEHILWTQESFNNILTVNPDLYDRTIVLNEIDGIECLPGDGTFYVFPDFSGMQAKLGCATDTDLAEKLLEAGVALVPGSAFGTPGHMRISFATSDENLQKAIERLKAA